MKSIQFPHPVLSPEQDDYISQCKFNIKVPHNKKINAPNNIIISVEYELSCKGLEELIQEEKAVVVINIKSSSLSYSRIFQFDKNEHTGIIRIPKFSVRKKIELTGTIVSTISNNNFKCDEFNNLYFEEETFSVQKGDILAFDNTITIYIDNHELKKPIDSIFSINKCPNQDKNIITYFDTDKININVNEEIYNSYYTLKQINNTFFLRYATGILIYPVLVEALDIVVGEYKNPDENNEYTDKQWFRIIEAKSKALGIDLSDPDSIVSIANKLLGNIVSDSLKGFKKTLEDTLDDNETIMIGESD